MLPLDVEGPVTAEVLTLARRADEIVLTGPCGPAAWRIQSGAGEHPLDTVRRVVEGALDGVRLVHSTSWRYERDAVVLTFVVVIATAAVGTMDAVPVPRAELARSSTTAAPPAIGVQQVLEHALRHLAWLAQDDDVVRSALDAGWHDVLVGYVPEPFRQLDTPTLGAAT